MTDYIETPGGARLIVVDGKTYDELVEILNRPESGTPKLAELFASPSPWADEEEK